MVKYILALLILFSSVGYAQTKAKPKPAAKAKTATTKKGKKGASKEPADSASVAEEEEEYDPIKEFELTLPLEIEIDPLTGKEVFYKDRKIKNDSARAVFMVQLKKERNSFKVFSKHPRKNSKNKDDIKLCINITAKDTNYLYTVTDTLCKDPEAYKLLYQKAVKDTVYMLIYIDAFTKSGYRGGACNGGHETKLYWVSWVAPKEKPKFKAVRIGSCIETITNMTKDNPMNWDGRSIIKFSYNHGSKFYDVEFDPANPQLGLKKSKM